MERAEKDLSSFVLNSEFRSLCEQLRPDVITDLIRKVKEDDISADEGASFIDNTLGVRVTSEHRALFMSKLDDLMVHCAGTKSLANYIKLVMGDTYNYGVDREDDGSDKSRFLASVTDAENPDSGGIFDPKRVKHIEFMVFAQMLNEKIRIEKTIARMPFFQGRPRNHIEMILGGDVDTWRREFSEKFC